jgi:hypothetical protein
MSVFRVSGAFVVLVLLAKSSLFVADDAKFLEVESLGSIEKRVGKLIDEAMRDLSEEKEREEEGASLSFAVAYVRTRKAVMRCVDGVCAWVRRGAEVAQRVASSASGIARGDSASAERHSPLLIEKNEQGFPQPTAVNTTL